MLDQLQKETESALWGVDQPKGSVIASDFYNATAIAALSDEEIVALLMRELLPVANPAFHTAQVLEAEVRRYPGSVAWFSPGSFRQRPPLETAIPSLVCAGDWVRMGARDFGAKGLCQERAYVCGLEAANSLLRRGVVLGADADAPAQHRVIPIRPDEPQVLLGRSLNAQVMNTVETLGLRWPWLA